MMQRSTLAFGALLLAIWATLLVSPQGARAQEEDAAIEPAPAAVEAAPADDAAAPIKRKSYLVWTYESLGLSYSLAFLFLSFMFVALLVMNMSKASRASIAPPDLVEAFEAHLNAKQYSEAYELAKADDSFLGKVLAAGLSRLSSGGDYPRAVEAMQEVGEEENLKLGNLLSYIGLIGTIAPMVGLLGTVQGMIMSFDVIATSPTSPKPSELAEGIATALFTTLVGLVIAIPAIAAYNILRNRVAELVLQAGIVSEGLMSRFEKSN